MFGSLRFLLAMMVMVGHLFWIPDFGRYAVVAFFMLSGYLMTLVVNDVYGFSFHGFKKFALNRALRLYPAYWAACALSLVLIFVLGEDQTRLLNSNIATPNNFASIAQNASLLFISVFPNSVSPRLSPATWALTTELIFYAAIAMGVSKTLVRTLIWLALSVAYVLATYAMDLYWHARYFAIPAGSLPFSLGALIYYLNRSEMNVGAKLRTRGFQYIILFLFVLNAVLGSVAQRDLGVGTEMEIHYLINIILSFVLILCFSECKWAGQRLTKIDSFLGEFSYPIYLIHWQCGVIVSFALLGEVSDLSYTGNAPAIVLSIALTLLFSYLIIRFIDRAIQQYRKKIRQSVSPSS